jgi:serine protease Do
VTLGARSGSQNAPSGRNGQQPAQPQQPVQPAQPRQPQTANSGAWLGISGLTVTPEIASAMSLDSNQTGALVEEVVSGSPAEKYGLQSGSKSFDLNGQQVNIGGDVITAVDGKSVGSMDDLSAAIKAQKPGDKVELTVLRNGKEVTVVLTLGERPAQSN